MAGIWTKRPKLDQLQVTTRKKCEEVDGKPSKKYFCPRSPDDEHAARKSTRPFQILEQSGLISLILGMTRPPLFAQSAMADKN